MIRSLFSTLIVCCLALSCSVSTSVSVFARSLVSSNGLSGSPNPAGSSSRSPTSPPLPSILSIQNVTGPSGDSGLMEFAIDSQSHNAWVLTSETVNFSRYQSCIYRVDLQDPSHPWNQVHCRPKSTPTSEAIWGIALTPDDSRLYFTGPSNVEDPMLHVMNLPVQTPSPSSGKKPKSNPKFNPNAVTVSDIGTFPISYYGLGAHATSANAVYYTDSNGTIWLLDVTNKKPSLAFPNANLQPNFDRESLVAAKDGSVYFHQPGLLKNDNLFYEVYSVNSNGNQSVLGVMSSDYLNSVDSDENKYQFRNNNTFREGPIDLVPITFVTSIAIDESHHHVYVCQDNLITRVDLTTSTAAIVAGQKDLPANIARDSAFGTEAVVTNAESCQVRGEYLYFVDANLIRRLYIGSNPASTVVPLPPFVPRRVRRQTVNTNGAVVDQASLGLSQSIDLEWDPSTIPSLAHSSGPVSYSVSCTSPTPKVPSSSIKTFDTHAIVTNLQNDVPYVCQVVATDSSNGLNSRPREAIEVQDSNLLYPMNLSPPTNISLVVEASGPWGYFMTYFNDTNSSPSTTFSEVSYVIYVSPLGVEVDTPAWSNNPKFPGRVIANQQSGGQLQVMWDNVDTGFAKTGDQVQVTVRTLVRKEFGAPSYASAYFVSEESDPIIVTAGTSGIWTTKTQPVAKVNDVEGEDAGAESDMPTSAETHKKQIRRAAIDEKSAPRIVRAVANPRYSRRLKRWWRK